LNARVSARLILVAAALLLLAACRRGDDGPPTDSQTPGPSPTVPASPGNATPGVAPGPRTEAGSVTVDGRARTWRLYVPGSLRTGEAAPLVIGLHGGIGSGEQFARNTRFDEQAEAGGFLAVYPDGTGIAKTWNAGACCGYAQRNGVDDVAFISALSLLMAASLSLAQAPTPSASPPGAAQNYVRGFTPREAAMSLHCWARTGAMGMPVTRRWRAVSASGWPAVYTRSCPSAVGIS